MPERPSKKQFELLAFIENFIAEKGYGPSYREIMRGCDYTSVATVASHVDNLIKKGQLSKKDRSARSLEVVGPADLPQNSSPAASPNQEHEKWLTSLIEARFNKAETAPDQGRGDVDELQNLLNMLKTLGLAYSAEQFQRRLEQIKEDTSKL